MVTANQLATYRQVQKRIEADFERDLRAIWAKASTLDPVRSARLIEQAFPALIDKYGLQAGAVAADWFESLTGVRATVPDSFKPEAFQASARWAVGERFTDTAESVALAVVADRLVSSGVRHVRQHARDTIDASARNSGGRVFYARKVMGETCDFCLILASRGPVYGSETSARLRGADGNLYHDDCDCQVVPVKGEWVPDETSPRGERWVGQDPGYDFEKLYAEEYKPYWNENDDIKDVLKRKRAVVAQTRTAKRRGRPLERGYGRIDGTAKSLGRAHASLRDVPPLKTRESLSTAISMANPDFRKVESFDLLFAYQGNCTRAVMASELRRAGYDLTAGPGEYEGGLEQAVSLWVKSNAPVRMRRVSTSANRSPLSELEEAIASECPDNSHGVASIGLVSGGLHAITWEIKDGRVIFHDPQIGRSDIGTDLQGKIASLREMKWARLDDAEPTDDVLNVVGS